MYYAERKKRLRKCLDHFKVQCLPKSAYSCSIALRAPFIRISHFCPYLLHLLCLYSLYQISVISESKRLHQYQAVGRKQGVGNNEFFPKNCSLTNCSQAPEPSKMLITELSSCILSILPIKDPVIFILI